jgi:acetaldehyde dehydrogenase (acetylating)
VVKGHKVGLVNLDIMTATAARTAEQLARARKANA